MRALVTGITGFVGGHLAENLVNHGDSITGCSRSGTWPSALGHLANRVSLARCDLTDGMSIARLLEHDRFDAVYHLAGLANPRACAENQVLAQSENVLATQNLYDAIRRSGQKPRIVFVSTGYVYGHPAPDQLPITTATPLHADHPYAATKLAAERCTMEFAAAAAISAVCVRAFNHMGPRQSPGYIVSDWAQQIADIEAGRASPPLRVGNLHARRDYTDVRDVVRAYRLLAHEDQAFTPGVCNVYNLGSGVSRSGREVLQILSAMSLAPWHWETKTRLLRPGEAEEIVVDSTPLQKRVGWKPAIDFQDTLRDTMDWYRTNRPS